MMQWGPSMRSFRRDDSVKRHRLAPGTVRRMAAFALQPHVAEFLDVVMHDETLDYRIEEVRITASYGARSRGPVNGRPSRSRRVPIRTVPAGTPSTE